MRSFFLFRMGAKRRRLLREKAECECSNVGRENVCQLPEAHGECFVNVRGAMLARVTCVASPSELGLGLA